MSYSYNVTYSGPLFDGRAAQAVDAACRAIEQEVAQEGARFVQSFLGTVLKHPTGYYQSQISAKPAGMGWLVHDSNVIYGPWLEGVGSRNSPVTRFPGYFTFRKVTPVLNRASTQIAERVMDRFIPRME